MEQLTTPARRRRPARRLVAAAVAAGALLVLTACGDDGATTSADTSATTRVTLNPAAGAGYGGGAPTIAPTTAVPAAGRVVNVATTPLGTVLVDGAGRTLYVFTKDEKNTSNCTGACLTTWPAFSGVPTAGPGVTAAQLGSFATADGKVQATIAGMPLYTYAGDTAAGDTKGHNVGGVWFAVDGTGTIKK